LFAEAFPKNYGCVDEVTFKLVLPAMPDNEEKLEDYQQHSIDYKFDSFLI